MVFKALYLLSLIRANMELNQGWQEGVFLCILILA